MASKILFVDDEKDLEGLVKLKFRKLIHREDFSFSFASNGIEALKILEKEKDIDAAVLDINMPEMDGFTLLKNINDMDMNIKCIIMSAYGDMDNMRNAMNLGAFDYLIKPINFIDLELTLKKTVKISREIKRSNDAARIAENELRMAKDQITIAFEKEKELSELKTRFLSMISHEYRTPLTVIQTSADIVRLNLNGNASNDVTRYIDNIEASIRHMTNLLDDVLQVGKIDARSKKLKFAEIDLKAALRSINSEYSLIDKNNHEFVFHYSGNPKAYCDEDYLRQILGNLLSNAAKYSDPGSEITTNVKNKDDFLVMTVEDKGIGVPDEELSNIFEPFYRTRNVGTKPGTGLGLSIVKKCVDALNGTISAESRINAGTKFIVTLPVKKD